LRLQKPARRDVSYKRDPLAIPFSNTIFIFPSPLIETILTTTIFKMSHQKYNNLTSVIDAIRAETEHIRKEKPQEVAAIYSGGLENQAGTNGQYYTTFDFANGMMRDGSMYTWKNFVILAENTDFSLKQLRTIIDVFDQPYSNYLRYSGFPKLGEFAVALRFHLKNEKDRKKFVEALRIFCAYFNQLSAWMFHSYPWHLSEQFKYENVAERAAVAPDLSRRVHIQDGRKITLTWTVDSPDGKDNLGQVDAYLAVKENPDLCQDFIDSLTSKGGSFTSLYDSAVVSGQSTYAWCPTISTAAVNVKERQCDAPIGRIRYSQGTGDKMIIQYGAVTEDIETPVLGEIPPPHHKILKMVGETALLNTFAPLAEKKEIWITVALA
jgi:hypothetical protein